jgi:hypothetical protein
MTRLARISSARLVSRLLDEPELVSVVQSLDAPVLRALVEHVGLEDAGEIVSLATTEQLERVFDDDLWRTQKRGEDDRFDPKRFGLWLEVLLQSGEQQALARVAEMDEDLLALGIGAQVLVIDVDALAQTMSDQHDDDDDQLEKALESCLYEELEEFRVIARDASTWDAVVTILVGLDKDHHDLLRRLLERLCAIGEEFIEENGGLYEVLTSEETLAEDVADARAQRREREGFVAPSEAASFLRLAKVTELAALLADTKPDPITKAHFRVTPAAPRVAPPPTPKVLAFLHELREAGVIEAPRARRLPPKGGAASLLRLGLSALRSDAAASARALHELAYLVNLLLAAHGGAARDPRGLRAIDVSDVVSAICDRGLAKLLGRKAKTEENLAALLAERGVVLAFRVGWHLVGDEDWSAAGLRAAARRARAKT